MRMRLLFATQLIHAYLPVAGLHVINANDHVHIGGGLFQYRWQRSDVDFGPILRNLLEHH